MRGPLALLAALLLAPVAAAQLDFTVTGKFEYADKAWGYTGWSGDDPPLPIRRADVIVIDDATQAVLGVGTTAQDGTFSIACTADGVVDVVARCDTDTNLNGSFQRIRVTTLDNVEYSLFSPVFPGHDPLDDLEMGTTTALPLLSGNDEGGPFNMLDMAVAAFEYITGPEIGAPNAPGQVRVRWPNPGGGSFASGSIATMSDDDGFDDAVILHEIGHVVHNLYSDSDSPGGTHFFGDSDQDPRLSFGEGYASFFGGTIQDELGMRAMYVDANGASQFNGWQLRLRLEEVVPYALDSYGAADEVAVCCALYDILDDEDSPDGTPGEDDDPIGLATLVEGKTPAQAWWDTFTGPVSTANNVNIDHAWNGWFAEHPVEPHYDALRAVYEGRRLHFFNDADEPNDARAAAAVSDPASATWSGDRTLYSSFDDPPSPGAGDEDHYAFEATKGSRVTVETRYPDGAADADTQADVFMELYDPQGALVASNDNGGTGRNARLADVLLEESGTWSYRIFTKIGWRMYGRYNHRATFDFENAAPKISSGPMANPKMIDDSQTSTLSAFATDANGEQAVGYLWSAPAGGTILGNGPVVTFQPPEVEQFTAFPVQVQAIDELGAKSVVKQVNVDVAVSGVCDAPPAIAIGGIGKPGAAGVPEIGAIGLPEIPGDDFTLALSNAPPLAPVTIVFGLELLGGGDGLPFDKGTLYPSIDFVANFVVPITGAFEVDFLIPPNPMYCGVTLYAQAIFFGDPGAAGPRQTSQTGWLAFTSGS